MYIIKRTIKFTQSLFCFGNKTDKKINREKCHDQPKHFFDYGRQLAALPC